MTKWTIICKFWDGYWAAVSRLFDNREDAENHRLGFVNSEFSKRLENSFVTEVVIPEDMI